VVFLPTEIAEVFASWDKSTPLDLAVLGPSVLPAVTRSYRNEEESLTKNDEGASSHQTLIGQPPVVPSPNRPGKVTNQLQYIQNHVINEVWKHKYAPFTEIVRMPQEEVDLPVEQQLPPPSTH